MAVRRERLLRRGLWIALVVALVGSAVIGGAQLWIHRGASGHVFDPGQAPSAPVVIVLGAEVRAGRPKPILAGRLDLTAELVRTGRAGAVLISGDAAGGSGDETSVMTDYLLAHGVPRDRLMIDPHGLDTYDSCKRAHDLYGVTRALVVSQSFHLWRAVALCRHVGIDADGVVAGCATCSRMTWARNRARDLLAGVKAVADMARDRPPAVA
jgi:vancomycin permeability regulator SanA